MKKITLSFILILALFSCSKSNTDSPSPAVTAPVTVNSRVVAASGFNYKEFYQPTASAATRKGLVILAHGDGGSEQDATLNEQCTALAREGYVAITTSYRSLNGSWDNQGARFKEDMEYVLTNAGTLYMIARNRSILGGISRGGNMTMALVLPNGQFAGTAPFTGIGGVLLQCSGGDQWKGSAVLYPVAFMSNQVDPTMGVVNANDFKTGLQSNMNPSVSAKSECLIYPSTGHCSDGSQNLAFMIKKVTEWLP
jgi:dienelactone hydrolase